MSLVTTKKGQLESLKLILSRTLILRLYTNDTQPNYYYEIEDYKEANGGDYKVFTLEPENWKLGFIADDPIATYPEQVFSFKGPVGLVYGYYLTNEDGDIVRWGEKFADGPYEVLRMGDTVTVVPRARLPRSPIIP